MASDMKVDNDGMAVEVEHVCQWFFFFYFFKDCS